MHRHAIGENVTVALYFLSKIKKRRVWFFEEGYCRTEYNKK